MGEGEKELKNSWKEYILAEGVAIVIHPKRDLLKVSVSKICDQTLGN